MSDHRPRTHDATDGGRRARWLRSGGAGLVAAAVPVLARAADVEQGRALEGADDFGKVALITILAAGSVLLLATLGRLYQRQRGIRWRFQDPDPPHDGGH
jgi:hypothetical protein